MDFRCIFLLPHCLSHQQYNHYHHVLEQGCKHATPAVSLEHAYSVKFHHPTAIRVRDDSGPPCGNGHIPKVADGMLARSIVIGYFFHPALIAHVRVELKLLQLLDKDLAADNFCQRVSFGELCAGLSWAMQQ